MSVVQDQYLYDEYCGSALPPPMARGRARELATRLGVSELEDICSGLQNNICRVTVDDGDRVCPDARDMDTVVVRCGKKPAYCVSAQNLMTEWQRTPRTKHFYSPKSRQMVEVVQKRRGTPKARKQLTCVERRGNAALCNENPSCYIERPSMAWLDRMSDCKPYVTKSCHDDAYVNRQVLLDAVLRAQQETPSGNFRRRIERNIDLMTETEICQAISGFYPSFDTEAIGSVKKLNAVTKAVLGQTDMLTAKTLQEYAYDSDITLSPSAAHALTAGFNAISAALSTQAPWWFYFIAYPSGRAALKDILSDSKSGQVFALSLLMTGMKGNWIFDDVMGLLDHVKISDYALVQNLASTVSGVLLRQISNKLK
jgi:hypothetical protein